MTSYLSYFKLKFKTGLQYRAAALAGLSTQFFFGFVFISVYVAFYESSSGHLPMKLSELISYIWLCQAFFSMVNLWYRDKEIISLIKSGNIAYELTRPQDLYLMWSAKILGDRLSRAALRFLPVIVIACLLPAPYNLNLTITIPRLILFLLSFVLSAFLMTALTTLYHVVCMSTLDDKGIVGIFMTVADLLSGLVIPIPFFPSYIQNITNILPFRYIGDFPYRLYVGNINMNDGYIGLIIQIMWIIILVVIGRLLMKRNLKKAVVQGG